MDAIFTICMPSVCAHSDQMDWLVVWAGPLDAPLPGALQLASTECENVFVYRMDQETLARRYLIPTIALAPGVSSELAQNVEFWLHRMRAGRMQWTRGASFEMFKTLLPRPAAHYSHFGFSDPDVVHGRQLITRQELSGHDIVTVQLQTLQIRQLYLCGHLVLLRVSRPELHRLWRDPVHCGVPLTDAVLQFDHSEDEGYFTDCAVHMALQQGAHGQRNTLDRPVRLLVKKIETADTKRGTIDHSFGCFDVQLVYGWLKPSSAGWIPDDTFRLWVRRIPIQGTHCLKPLKQYLQSSSQSSSQSELSQSSSQSSSSLSSFSSFSFSSSFLLKNSPVRVDWFSWTPEGTRWWINETIPLSLLHGYDLRIDSAGVHAVRPDHPPFTASVGPSDCGTYETQLAEFNEWKQYWPEHQPQTHLADWLPGPLTGPLARDYMTVVNETGMYRFKGPPWPLLTEARSKHVRLAFGTRYCDFNVSSNTGFLASYLGKNAYDDKQF